MRVRELWIAIFISLIAGHALAAIVATDVRVGRTYAGACDASAAAAIDNDRFVIASDEMDDDNPGRVNRLHVYRRGAAPPVSQLDLTPAVQHSSLVTHTDSDKRESDFEGAARLGDRIFWITSHGPNKNGKSRPDRFRLIATDVAASPADPSMRLVGCPEPRPAYANLFLDLAVDTRLAGLHLADLVATPPEQGGFNIEGLARTRDEVLLIGLRSPLAEAGFAVLVPLLNADALLAGTATKARFGDPIRLDLGSRGIRDIAYWKAADVFIIIAGSPTDAENFALFTWKGTGQATLLKDGSGGAVSLAGLHPESLVLLESGELLVLSDDGDEPAAGSPAKANKDVPSRQRTFRTLSMKLVSR